MDDYRIDSQKLSHHPHRVAQWDLARGHIEEELKVYPIYLEVSPVGGCFHKCVMCGVDYVIAENLEKSKIPQLDADLLIDRIHEMGGFGVRSIMHAGAGEPLLHKRINEIVWQTYLAGVDTAFTTNGVLLNQLDLTGVSWVKVSINGGTRETYAKVHQCKEKDWDTVWRNLAAAVQRKGNCTIGAQMVLLPENEHEVDNIKAMGESIGLDYVVIKPFSQHKFSQNKQYENYIPIVPVTSGKMIVREAALKTKTIPYDVCHSTGFFWGYIEADGEVYGCSAYLLDERFKYGNINTHTFKEIWEGDKRRANIERMRNHDIKQCRVNCRMNQSNIYLNDIVNGIPHKNFI